uniref:Transmembrane protein n=1 Tax=Phaseolus vulgaris TaxID=3885 RepID=V7AXZ0_PHAVU|nr:hypothetical protein PHAVU_009G210400g [Phaseolus vulgaris]ESW10449.1 hypothetical protein PHAVU_009G210400g [Phaseolus vulgaris]
MEDEGSHVRERSLAAPLIFLIVAAFQFAYYCLDHVAKQSGSDREKEDRLRAEIKQLLKEASSMSQPSTFARAAKLKRLATAKERELSKWSLLSWKSGGVQSNSAPIGIISWLVICARVCRFVRRAYSK